MSDKKKSTAENFTPRGVDAMRDLWADEAERLVNTMSEAGAKNMQMLEKMQAEQAQMMKAQLDSMNQVFEIGLGSLRRVAQVGR